MRTISTYWRAFWQIVLSLRVKLMQARLKASGRIYFNIAFADLEKKYLGRAANHQIGNWQTLVSEPGTQYIYPESINNREHRKIIRELPRRLFLANNAHVFSSRGIVSNSYYNCVVLETLETWGGDVNFSTEFISISKKVSRVFPGLSFSLLSLGADINYAHFLFDTVSKLLLVPYLPMKPDRFLVSGPHSAWKEKILNHLGIADRTVWITDQEEVSCEQLVFTSRLNFSRHVSPFATRALRQIFNIPASSEDAPTKVIVASRRNARDRKNRFEELLESKVPPFAQIVDFESVSMAETIRLCQACRFFIGIHGAAFSNLVFANPAIKVVELQIDEVLPEWHRNYYQTMYEQLDIAYRIQVIGKDMAEADFNKLVEGFFKDALLLSQPK